MDTRFPRNAAAITSTATHAHTIQRIGATVAVALAALTCLPWIARADVGPPIEVTILDAPVTAEAGQPFVGRFRVTADSRVFVSAFLLEPNAGWNVLSLTGPASAVLDSAGILDLSFNTVALDPSYPLDFSFLVDGELTHIPFDLSPEHRAIWTAQRELRIDAATSGTPPAPTARTALRPGPALSAVEEVAAGAARLEAEANDATSGSSGAAKLGRTIHVHGRLTYKRYDWLPTGIDAATVTVYAGCIAYATDVTDAYGYFSFTINWVPSLFCGSVNNPDLYVHIAPENAAVGVGSFSLAGVLVAPYSGPVWKNYPGTDLDMGELAPKDPLDNRWFHILTTVSRAWRWIAVNAGIDVLKVTVAYPWSADVPFYKKNSKRIFMTPDRVWEEGTIIHEYGHHFIWNYAKGVKPSYCNSGGFCDGGDCGHCAWCTENQTVAWGEGWPNWLGDIVPRGFAQDYGQAAISPLDWESHDSCFVNGLYGDPLRMEGPCGAVLRDIDDPDVDSEPFFPGYTDLMNEGFDEILTVVTVDKPTTPIGFLQKFMARYPLLKEQLWETAKNNGFELDTQSPGATSFLSSSSHSVAVPSADGTITMGWTTPIDDASGIEGYAIWISVGGPSMPPATLSVGNVITWTSDQLPSGTYWINLRAKDRSGKWSPSYASAGPYVIDIPQPADLVPTTPDQWAYPLVPAPNGVISSGYVPIPSVLNGNATGTWWNLAVLNHGELATPANATTLCATYLDGAYLDYSVIGALPQLGAGQTKRFNNYGPLSIPGGRHTLSAWVDAGEQLAEYNEPENDWGHQWVWSPLTIAQSAPVLRAAPPPRIGGWSSVPAGPLYSNCDGLRASLAFGFYGVYAQPLSNGDDYDVSLHLASTSTETGFDVAQAASQQFEGFLDAVLLFRPLITVANYDIGVVNFSGGSSSYRARLVPGSSLPFGVATDLSMAQDELMLLRTVVVSSEQTGPTLVTLNVTPASRRTRVAWYDKTFAVGGILDSAHATATDLAGEAHMEFSLGTTGMYFLAVYRDPRDGTGPVNLTLQVESSPPDYAPYAPAGWYSALVPRAQSDGSAGSVPAPTTLIGDGAPTWLNLAALNTSPTTGSDPVATVMLDGTAVGSAGLGTMRGGTPVLLNSFMQLTVPAGRHVLTMNLDAAGALHESDDANNAFGAQWVWLPPALSPSAPVSRALPPSPVVGWSTGIDPSVTPLLYDCDGLGVTLAPDGRTRAAEWVGVAAAPATSADDIDLELHEAASGAQAGFAEMLASSAWSSGHSELVLVNFNRTAVRPFNVGVINASGAGGGGSPKTPGSYTAELVGSIYLATNPRGFYGDFTLAAGSMLRLHEVWLDPGAYLIHLQNRNGSVDWGMAIHPGNLAYLSKSTVLDGGIAWTAGAGADEWMTFVVDAARHYCVSVWKQGTADLPLAGRYRLEFLPASTAVVPETPPALKPARTAIARIYPNPFNPRTTIAFDLRHEQLAHVDVYNARGECVTSLAAAILSAGRHELVWDGTDTRGRRVASGAYVLRLSAADGTCDERRVTLVK